ncbi:MAG: trigger factor [Minisyncoccia bacterium]
MKYQINQLPNSQIEIKIELNKDDLFPYKEKALKELAKNVKVDGFREGRVPLEIVETKIPPLELAEKTASFAIEEIYPKIIIEEKINALGYPEINITKIIPNQELEFKVKVAVLKEIILPDYKSIAKEEKKNKKIEVSVTEKEIEEALKWIYLSRSQNKTEKPEEMKIDDEFARSLGNFENLEALKKSIKEGIEMEKKQKEEEKWRMGLLEKIMEKIEWNLPEVLIQAEIHKMIDELKMKLDDMGLPFEKYLEQIKKNEEDLKKDLKEPAEKRVKIALILREITIKENISASEKEIEERVDRIISQVDEDLKTKIDLEQLKSFVSNLVENEKVFSFLENL